MTTKASPAALPDASRGDAGAPGSQYYVRLENFEGPLDLLLHLIQQHELDILDIPIAFVAERYVTYITLMQELNIDVASEYLLMAATLTHIKSKFLLPTPPDDQDDIEAEAELDPRAELVRRLLEYQKYKDAAEQLGSRSVVGRDIFGRGSAAPAPEGPAPLAQLGLFKLLDAFQSVLDRVEKTLDHQIEFDRLSITERINELVDLLREKPQCEFIDLFTGQLTRAEVIITFLALLEMTRLRMTRLTQAGPLDPIYVEARLGDAVPDEPIGDMSASARRIDPSLGELEISPTDDELAAAAMDDVVDGEPGDDDPVAPPQGEAEVGEAEVGEAEVGEAEAGEAEAGEAEAGEAEAGEQDEPSEHGASVDAAEASEDVAASKDAEAGDVADEIADAPALAEEALPDDSTEMDAGDAGDAGDADDGDDAGDADDADDADDEPNARELS